MDYGMVGYGPGLLQPGWAPAPLDIPVSADLIIGQHLLKCLIMDRNCLHIQVLLYALFMAHEFSVAQHVQRLTTSSAQTLYALRVLRCHGLSDAALQNIYHATVIARLTYAASAWRGFTKASDRQRINSVIDRARRLGYCAQNLQNFDELCDTADDELFSKVAQLPNHVLHELLPPLSTASQQYNLRHRTHSLQLPQHLYWTCTEDYGRRLLPLCPHLCIFLVT